MVNNYYKYLVSLLRLFSNLITFINCFYNALEEESPREHRWIVHFQLLIPLRTLYESLSCRLAFSVESQVFPCFKRFPACLCEPFKCVDFIFSVEYNLFFKAWWKNSLTSCHTNFTCQRGALRQVLLVKDNGLADPYYNTVCIFRRSTSCRRYFSNFNPVSPWVLIKIIARLLYQFKFICCTENVSFQLPYIFVNNSLPLIFHYSSIISLMNMILFISSSHVLFKSDIFKVNGFNFLSKISSSFWFIFISVMIKKEHINTKHIKI